MTILGIDVARDTLEGVVVSSSGSISTRHQLDNTPAALQTLFDELTSRWTDITVVAEPTGDAGRTLMAVCLERGLPCRLLNPILTKQFTRATIRGRKTDRDDALAIARLGLQGEGRLVTAADLTNTKPFVRTAQTLQHTRQILAAVRRRVDRILPNERTLQTLLDHTLAELAATVTAFRKRAVATSDQTVSTLLQSIPGIGPTIATALLAEIGSVDRFSSADALVAYAGLDPRVRQSGTSLHATGRLTKRGSPVLRQVLFQAAMTARQRDPELKTYYETKRQAGRTYTEVLVMVARKVLYRVYAVWKRKTPYVVTST